MIHVCNMRAKVARKWDSNVSALAGTREESWDGVWEGGGTQKEGKGKNKDVPGKKGSAPKSNPSQNLPV